MLTRVFVPVLLAMGFSTLSSAADTDGGGCPAPKVTEQTSAVDVPQYAASEDDDTPDPAEEANARAWSDYQRKVTSTLKASSDPRDWAIAVSVDFGVPSGADRAEKIALLHRAAKAAPDDVLTQWMILAGARHLDADDLVSAAADRLTQIEPDNAAAWMERVQRAAMHHDRAGVTAALGRMSATSRMDNHYSELAKSVADAFERDPMPEELMAATGENSRSPMPYVFAMAVSSASALPAYQFLTTACLWDPSGRNADRTADCERIGRTMALHSDTLISQSIGFVVLRLSRTFNEDDVEAARQMDWVMQNFSDLATKPGRVSIYDESHEAESYHTDWVETGSETEAMRRRIVRAGLSPTPPDSWVGKTPRFSAERIRQDEEISAERLAKADY